MGIGCKTGIDQGKRKEGVMSRAESRLQKQKRKRKTRKLIRDVWREPELAEDERFVGIEAGVHSRRCSCPMCRRSRKNPWAKSDRLTIQERREEQDAREQLEEA